MKLRVLGCSGGIGAGLRTTSLLVDNDVLIDAGSGVGDLYLDEMTAIRHIFITHTHLDHIGFLPLLIDSIFDRIREPIVVHAQASTIAALKKHVFNWIIWPDFSELPRPENGVLRFEAMEPGESVWINGRSVKMIEVNHTVPGVGYLVTTADSAFAFSGDTTTNDSFWSALNEAERLDLLIVEAAFANHQEKIAELSKHYCPKTLTTDLAKLRHKPQIYLSHLKPGEEMNILTQVKEIAPGLELRSLVGDEIFQL